MLRQEKMKMSQDMEAQRQQILQEFENVRKVKEKENQMIADRIKRGEGNG